MAHIKFAVHLAIPDERVQAAKRDALLALENVAGTNGGSLEEIVEKGAEPFGPPPRPISGEDQATPRGVFDIAVDAAANREIFDWEDLPDDL